MRGWIDRRRQDPGFGFTLKDERYLRHWDNPQKDPTLSVFNGEIDQQEPSIKYCPNCNCLLNWEHQDNT